MKPTPLDLVIIGGSHAGDFLEQVDRSRIYRKCVEGTVAEGIEWTHQPFCSEPPFAASAQPTVPGVA